MSIEPTEAPVAQAEITARSRKLVTCILDLALTTPKEVADVFVDYSPHVQSVSVRIHVFGWNEGVPSVLGRTIYLDQGPTSENQLEEFHVSLVAFLNNIRKHR